MDYMEYYGLYIGMAFTHRSRDDNTGMEWLYRHGMTIQTLNDYTDIKWLYRH